MHRVSHWILLVLVMLAAVFTLREVHGQTSTNAGAQFQGMPSMAGAQAGLGAQAGPAQGGIGLQGSDGAGLHQRRPRGLDEPRSMAQGTPDGPLLAANDTPITLLPATPKIPDNATPRDTGVAKDVGSTPTAAKRSVRKAAKRVRSPNVASIQ
jgi:hypothetical protein